MTYPVFRVALPLPLAQTFDYLAPVDTCLDPESLQRWVGCRVQVPFGRQHKVGMVIEVVNHSEIKPGIKVILQRIDTQALLPIELWQSILWLARYYQRPAR
jgi:primosomal protein N' (replication factor Y)